MALSILLKESGASSGYTSKTRRVQPKIAQKVVGTAIFDGYSVKSKESSFIEKHIIKKPERSAFINWAFYIDK